MSLLEKQNPSEKIGRAIMEPATKHTQNISVEWMTFFWATIYTESTLASAQVIMYCSKDPLLFCVP